MAFSPQRSWMQHLVCAGALMSGAEGGPVSSKGAMFCAVFLKKNARQRTCIPNMVTKGIFEQARNEV